MRLWTIHPKHLDSRGLVALWREALLAQAVLRGRTVGYRAHPQLIRFRAHSRPVAGIAAYLRAVCDEASARGYSFDRSKIARAGRAGRIPETDGQLRYEWGHLNRKLSRRDPARRSRHRSVASPEPHPLFSIVRGGIRPWERRVRPVAKGRTRPRR